MEFEHKGVVYRFAELTLAQMEILSGLLSGANDRLRGALSVEREASGAGGEIEIAVSLNDIIQELRQKRLLARFIAVCVVQKGKEFDETELAEREKVFKNLPYNIVEDVLGFFFNTGLFLKIVTPSFLILRQDQDKPEESTEA